MGRDGAEAVLTLRAVIAYGNFEQYWPVSTSNKSTSGSTPGAKQGQYPLGA